MPTGYTAKVADGDMIDFKDFAMLCARAFGITMDMRDDPLSAPIPEEFPVDTKYHDEALAKAQERLAYLNALNPLAVLWERDKEFAALQTRFKEREEDRIARKNRYISMLQKVDLWTPPEELKQMKEFMREQLTTGMQFDCSPNEEPKEPTVEDWFKEEVREANWSIDYHTKNREKYIQGKATQNRLLKELRASLEVENEPNIAQQRI